MTPEVAHALELSIANWKRNEQALDPWKVRQGIRNCALCRIFMVYVVEWDECLGCPIEQAGGRYCKDTPYVNAYFRWEDWAHKKHSTPIHPFILEWRTREAYHIAAHEERLFLESLRDL